MWREVSITESVDTLNSRVAQQLGKKSIRGVCSVGQSHKLRHPGGAIEKYMYVCVSLFVCIVDWPLRCWCCCWASLPFVSLSCRLQSSERCLVMSKVFINFTSRAQKKEGKQPKFGTGSCCLLKHKLRLATECLFVALYACVCIYVACWSNPSGHPTWQRDACKSNHRPHITSWPKQLKPQQNSTNWAINLPAV